MAITSATMKECSCLAKLLLLPVVRGAVSGTAADSPTSEPEGLYWGDLVTLEPRHLDPHAEINDFGKAGSAVRGTGRAGRLTVAQSAAREGSLSFSRESVMRHCRQSLCIAAVPAFGKISPWVRRICLDTRMRCIQVNRKAAGLLWRSPARPTWACPAVESVALRVSYMKVEGKPPPFDPKIFLARVGVGKTRAELRRRQIVFSQGDPADAVFYIQKGKIELRVSSQQGKEAILATLGVDDFFGEGCLAGQPLRMATAIAVTECSVVRLEKPAMIAVVHDEPEFSALFISYLLTRNIRRAAANRKQRGLGKPGTFDFLGFTFICGKSRAGKFLIHRKSRRDRVRAKLTEIKEELRRRMHGPVREQAEWLKQVVTGFCQYHAVPTNGPALGAFRYHVIEIWRRTLRRRGQRHRMTWRRIGKLADQWLPKPRILHPWPNQRFAVKHPRWEPYAGKPHVRFCAGGAQ